MRWKSEINNNDRATKDKEMLSVSAQGDCMMVLGCSGAESRGGKATHLACKLIRDGFDSKIYYKCGNEHQYTPCTETQPKCEQKRTSIAVMTAKLALEVVVVFLRIVTEAGLMFLSTIDHWVGCG